MTDKDKKSHRNTLVGVALVIGAALGMIVGVIVGGGAGMAIGTGIGGGVGVVFGAAWDALHPSG